MVRGKKRIETYLRRRKMKIILTIKEDREGNTAHSLCVGDLTKFSIYSLCECPEDAIIGRYLIDGYDLLYMLKLGHELGKDGEELEIEILNN